jgi:hypothetical protein
MHLFLTDRLTCPRCGPEFGLILLADEVRDQRILRGVFGCANCRERYPVEGGFGDLRPPPREPLPRTAGAEPGEMGPPETRREDGEPDVEEHVRVAALLGVTEGPGTLLLTGELAHQAGALGALLEGVEIVAIHASLRNHPEGPGVSRMVAGPRIPFYSGAFRGVALGGTPGKEPVAEGARVTAPLGRLVVFGADEEVRKYLEEEGFRTLLWEDGVLVTQRPGLHER